MIALSYEKFHQNGLKVQTGSYDPYKTHVGYARVKNFLLRNLPVFLVKPAQKFLLGAKLRIRGGSLPGGVYYPP